MKKIITIILSMMFILGLTACSEEVNPNNEGNGTTATNETTTTTETQTTTTPPQSSIISEDEAREIALERVGGGTVTEVEFDECEGRLIYEIEVKHNGVEYEVEIDAITGEVIKFEECLYSSPTDSPNSSTAAPQTQPQQPDNQQNGAEISLERAIEIGHEEIVNRGYSGTFRESCRGVSRGQNVWELLYRVEGGRKPLAEIYISIETGDVVKFEWDD